MGEVLHKGLFRICHGQCSGQTQMRMLEVFMILKIMCARRVFPKGSWSRWFSFALAIQTFSCNASAPGHPVSVGIGFGLVTIF